MWYFTADTHFGHANIIKYCQRPFASAGEMNQVLINNINERVQPEDTLFHLGDWSFGRDKKTNDAQVYLEQIRCKKVIIIPGNHDPHHANGLPKKEFAELFAGCYPFLRLKLTEWVDEPTEIFLFHYACRVWIKSHHGTWHLYGHSHGTLPDLAASRSLDIGVDCHNFRPLNVPEIAELMAKKKFEPIDHHG
jgi:calcineurin-like phosphoesterase family protein